jgi:hypothetical protein
MTQGHREASAAENELYRVYPSSLPSESGSSRKGVKPAISPGRGLALLAEQDEYIKKAIWLSLIISQGRPGGKVYERY